MTDRQNSSSTLLAGMSAVKYGSGDVATRKRELEDLIRVSWLYFLIFFDSYRFDL